MKKMTLLHVDDKQSERELFTALLENYGYEILSATNGWEALDILKDHHVDIIISDILMPEMDGYLLCETVKKDQKLKSKPFIFSSATFTSKQDEQLCYDLGMDCYIRKDSDMDQYFKDLMNAITRVTAAGYVVQKIKSTNKSILKTYNQRVINKLETKLTLLELEQRKIAQLEDLIKEKNEEIIHLQKTNLLGILAGGIAHDFNNMLSIILGATQLISEKDETDPEELVELIMDACYRAKNLTKQILLFSRKEKTEKTVVEISTLINDIINLSKHLIPVPINKEYSIPVDQVKVKANTTQLTQVMVNLFTNAISAMNNIGTLTIKLSTEMIDSNHSITENNINPGEYIKLSVADTGCGMDSETSARIFEPYYTTKEKGKGTGLGLSVSYDIIKEHDGAITVDTQPGKGTCFNIYLPVAEEALDDQAEEKISKIEGKANVLFIDDEEDLVFLNKKALTNLGFHVHEFTDPEKALKTFKKQKDHIDIVISDIVMPVIPGHKLASEMLSIKPDLPIILITGYNDFVDINEVNKIGVKEVLYKPVMIEELATTISEILN